MGMLWLGLTCLTLPTSGLAHTRDVTITRDDWGIAHVHGATDADAVFGMMYAQAEDDFGRIERNYLQALGRTAEVDGEAAIWTDLRQRMFTDPKTLQADYARSPAWLRALMVAWADGLNTYLAKHPEVRPKVLTHFEPWMALSFSEGSIGGDIEQVPLGRLKSFYEGTSLALSDVERGVAYEEPTGSNGIALAPSRTRDGHALLLINPHTSFFFRAEQQVTSDEGLNVYGAATWGQFFIYQGFNASAGWMHTSSGVDAIDEFAETVRARSGGRFVYRDGKRWRLLKQRRITITYRLPSGAPANRTFTVYTTHNGPVMGLVDGKWIAVALMNRPLAALQQSFLRTKATDLDGFLEIARLRANSSNDTIFADQKGDIAYLHPQFVPLRDDRFDYTSPVDGRDPTTRWKGLHSLESLPHVYNPKTGYVFNTNNWPWTAAGEDSPKASDYPRYMDQAGENPRGLHAVKLLQTADKVTLEGLRDLAYDPWLPTFDRLLPNLGSAFDALPPTDPRHAGLAAPMRLLLDWDRRWSSNSQATSLAVFWGEALWRRAAPLAAGSKMSVWDYMEQKSSPEDRLQALQEAVARLNSDFGSWRVAWGDINRFQRNDGEVEQVFDDVKPSYPVPFTSNQWGALASFGAKAYPGTRRYYGTSGNSFVAVVEFGPRVRAYAISIGGQSGHPQSAHFSDQVDRYVAGNLRPIYFYADDLKGHVEAIYTP
ncbi:Glutaryl-7-aminocephalosporanic-acid acylase (plasmid) [Asticcacaulis sp. MM231]|uniref:penicillin acylase family protein n=1 Tax=Asticcacaulis sp. MM231 TaxID=3157666 RepID=UPI0032D5733A